MNHHFVTGATGFIGSLLVLELLEKDPTSEIWCLSRANSQQSAKERLQHSLRSAAQIDVTRKLNLDDLLIRCHALEGDLTLPDCGIEQSIRQNLPKHMSFWHSAASLNYEDRYREEIELINIQGTRHAIGLARLLAVRQFNYFSTAYVAGQASGVIFETLMDRQQAVNNVYEYSKVNAEWLVASAIDLHPRIMRPSIVIGHSQTYALANSYSGLYGFIRRIAKSISIMERLDKHYLNENALRLRYDYDGYINFIPIDHVVSQAVSIALPDRQQSDVGVYHLTNSTPVHTGEFLSTLFQYLNLLPPIVVEDDKNFNEIDQSFSKGIDFYNSYLLYSKIFNRNNSDAALNNTQASSFALTKTVLTDFFGWYLDYLMKTDPRVIERAHLTQRITEYRQQFVMA